MDALPPSLTDSSAGPEEAAATHELENGIDLAISGLPTEQREVLLLRDAEGLTAPEVAAVLGITVEAVKSRLHRARVAVRARIAPLLGREIEPSESCPDVAQLFSQHLEGEITAAVCARMEKHLEGCARCRATCDSLQHVLTACRAAPHPVPAAVQKTVRAALLTFLRHE